MKDFFANKFIIGFAILVLGAFTISTQTEDSLDDATNLIAYNETINNSK